MLLLMLFLVFIIFVLKKINKFCFGLHLLARCTLYALLMLFSIFTNIIIIFIVKDLFDLFDNCSVIVLKIVYNKIHDTWLWLRVIAVFIRFMPLEKYKMHQFNRNYVIYSKRTSTQHINIVLK